MRASDFDFELPEALIAQTPTVERDQSRLLVLDRVSGRLEHHTFGDITAFLRPGDVLILNDSRVLKARLRARHSPGGRPFEVLLLEENETNDWWAMMKPGKRAPVGTSLVFEKDSRLSATVTAVDAEGHRRLLFSGIPDVKSVLDRIGEVPLPPYIRHAGTSEFDTKRYQTVYARQDGSVAAPTAGLHFTESLLQDLQHQGVDVRYVTLHVGLGTFAPVKTEEIEQHVMHEEQFEVCPETADAINKAKGEGRRVIAVGTTSVRVLEAVAQRNSGKIVAQTGRTRIFLYPPAYFQIVDGLLTNFHLPRSTLLMLVSAFAAPGGTTGRELILRAYREAINKGYRFFSYGDAMLIT